MRMYLSSSTLQSLLPSWTWTFTHIHLLVEPVISTRDPNHLNTLDPGPRDVLEKVQKGIRIVADGHTPVVKQRYEAKSGDFEGGFGVGQVTNLLTEHAANTR